MASGKYPLALSSQTYCCLTEPTHTAPQPVAEVIVRAVFTGMLVLLAGTIPRNIVFAANTRYFTQWPWAVPVVALYLFFFWRYLDGAGPPASTSQQRRSLLRAKRLSLRVWIWSLLAGVLGIVALVLLLHLLNRLVVLPAQQLPELKQVPSFTLLCLLLMAAPVAGIVEEAAFRGYMQGPIEQRCGLPAAILITGTLFAVAHLDFTWILWPYYVLVAAIYGTITYVTKSILPGVVLHTGGNIYSNLDLWLHGRAEWQTAAKPAPLVWSSGADTSFWLTCAALLLCSAATVWACYRLAKIAGN